MDEPLAWLMQAQSDRQAAEALVAGDRVGLCCHAIAKWQQTVEKSVKAMIAALNEAGILHVVIGADHGVERFVPTLVRLPRRADQRSIQSHLQRLLRGDVRAGIRELDALVPRLPPRKNTEYPYPSRSGRWTYPAALGEFSAAEVDRFRELAFQVSSSAQRIVTAIRRRPR